MPIDDEFDRAKAKFYTDPWVAFGVGAIIGGFIVWIF